MVYPGCEWLVYPCVCARLPFFLAAHKLAQAVYRDPGLFGDRDPVKEPGTATGTPGNWWTVFANVPDAFDHTLSGFQFYRSPNRTLDEKLRELGQTRAGFCVGSRFVFSQHWYVTLVLARTYLRFFNVSAL